MHSVPGCRTCRDGIYVMYMFLDLAHEQASSAYLLLYNSSAYGSSSNAICAPSWKGIFRHTWTHPCRQGDASGTAAAAAAAIDRGVAVTAPVAVTIHLQLQWCLACLLVGGRLAALLVR